MSRALVLAFLRQRFTSPMRLALLALALLWPLAFVALSVTLSAVQGKAFLFALVLGAGAIGQDVSSGVVQIMFARPVRRSVYVASRWFAAGLGATVLGAVQVLLAVALVAARGGDLVPTEVLAIVLENALLGYAAAAVIVLFSSLVNGVADIGVYFGAWITLELSFELAARQHWQTAAAIIVQLQHTLSPGLDLGWIGGHGPVSWTGPVTVVSTIALGLGLAILAVNRKELSYAVD